MASRPDFDRRAIAGRLAPAAAATWGLLVLSLALAGLAYYPILRNYFFGDDIYNLYKIANDRPFEYLITPHSGHVLIFRNAVFWLCAAVFGPEPGPFFRLVLATHLVNVGLLFALAHRISGSARVACFTAVLWGVSPVHEGTLGWYSVYGQVLVGTVVLWLAWRLARVGERPPRSASLVLWCVLLVVASTCFGVGTGMAVGFPLVAWVMLPPSPARRRIVVATAISAAAVIALYLGTHVVYYSLYPDRHGSLGHTLGALNRYSLAVPFLGYLLGDGVGALSLGAMVSQRTQPGQATIYVAAAVFAAGLLAVWWRGAAATARAATATLLLALCAYGTIALGRAPFFATLKEHVIHAPRYHYVGLLGLAACLAVILGQIGRWWRIPPAAASILVGLWLLATAIRIGPHGLAIDHHDRYRRNTMHTVDQISEIVRSAPGDEVRIANRDFNGIGPMLRQNRSLFPGWAGAFVVFFPDNVVDGKRVLFEEPRPAAIAAARDGRRTAGLLVPPAQPADAQSGAGDRIGDQ